MKRDLDTLLQELRNIHEDFRLILTDKIEVADWVRWKCRYGWQVQAADLAWAREAEEAEAGDEARVWAWATLIHSVGDSRGCPDGGGRECMDQ